MTPGQWRSSSMRVILLASLSTAAAASSSCGQTRLLPIGIFDGAVPDAAAGERAPGDDAGPSVVPPCPDDMVGFAIIPSATLPGGTTGGEGGPLVTASTADELQAYALTEGPLVIQVDAMISATGEIRVHSDKTIEGVAPGAGLMGGAGLTVLDAHNVIIRRMTISRAIPPADAIKLQNANHVWIDHCDLSSDLTSPKDTYDGLVDITHASEYVTLSWTVLHDHDRPSIIGHSNSAAAMAEDVGHLIVTYHHNWFHDVNSDTPRVRFGTVHAFNNLFQDIPGNAIISQMNAMVLVEANVSSDVKIPITTAYEDPVQGFVSSKLNRCIVNCGSDNILMPKEWPAPPPYPYVLDDSTAITPAFVQACAGPGF